MALKAVALRTMKPDRHPDGRYGLCFNVKPSGARSFLQRLTIDGKRRIFGLSPCPVVSLAEARDQAIDNVRLLRKGINPIVERKREAAVPTFAEAREAYLAVKRSGWKAGSRNEANWRSSLEHAGHLDDRPVNTITLADVAAIVVRLIDADMVPTARNVRQRLRAIFD